MPYIPKLSKQSWIFIFALWLAAAHGLLYILLIPPWQHHDEPNHFEVAWLIAKMGRLPDLGDEDQNMRREVALSMIENDFFKEMGFLPDLDKEPIWIGDYSQIGQPPLYYILASIPIRLTNSFDVTEQLYAARLTSLILFLLTVFTANGLIIELTSADNPLRWMVPISIALLPGMPNLMTSVNSDAMAVMVFSLFLWGCVRLIIRGVNIYRILWVLGALVLCILAKETSYAAILLLPGALLFSIFQSGRWRWVAWVICLASIVIGVIVTFSWGDVALWYRNTNQSKPTRTASIHAPVGEYVFELQSQTNGNQQSSPKLYQLLPQEKITNLQGKTVTVGAWIWANKPVQAEIITLTTSEYNSNELEHTQKLSIGETPIFYSFSTTVPKHTTRAWVFVSNTAKDDASVVTLYYDGLVLTEGKFPSGTTPVWENFVGNSGTWEGKVFENIVRNSSAESGGLRLRPWVDLFGEKILPPWERPSMVLYSVLDMPGAGWYFTVTAENLFKSFWAKFGWGNVPMIGSKTYWALGIVTLVGALGTLFSLKATSKKTQWEALLFLGGASLAVWIFSWVRGSYYLIYKPYIPSSRYAYPVIIPTVTFLCLGWSLFATKISKLIQFPNRIWSGIFGAFFVGLDLLAFLSINNFYYR